MRSDAGSGKIIDAPEGGLDAPPCFFTYCSFIPCLATADEDKKVSKLGDEAHRTLLESVNRGRESAHFTEAVMRDLPATAPGVEVSRQGVIDAILFRQNG